MLQISLFYQEELLGHATYSSLVDSMKSARKIILNNFRCSKTIEIDNGEDVIIKINASNSKNKTVELVELSVTLVDVIELVQDEVSDLGLYGHLMPVYLCGMYDQYIIDIFHLWGQGKEMTNWETLSEENKDSYIRACSIWSGLPKYLSPGNSFIVDGNQISDWFDFYYFLNKSIYGERGFFALGLDSLGDSLIELSKASSQHNSKIIFKNKERIESAFGYNSKQYFVRIIELLESGGFTVFFE